MVIIYKLKGKGDREERRIEHWLQMPVETASQKYIYSRPIAQGEKIWTRFIRTQRFTVGGTFWKICLFPF